MTKRRSRMGTTRLAGGVAASRGLPDVAACGFAIEETGKVTETRGGALASCK